MLDITLADLSLPVEAAAGAGRSGVGDLFLFFAILPWNVRG